MNILAAKPPYTPEDLLAMPDGDRYELIDGNLVERNVGSLASLIGGELFGLLRAHVKQHNLGWVWPGDNTYQCFPHAPTRVRRPDVSFIRQGRLPGGQAAGGHERVVPDVVAEVLSPNDMAYDIDERLEDYLRAGVRLVWVVSPTTRTVQVYRADNSGTRLRESDDLTGEDVVPGFRCRVGDLFPPPPAQPAPQGS
jgi:Uma2 family endonuclease